MAIQKRKFLYAILLAVVFLAAGVLFGCGGGKRETEVTFSGNGEIASQTLENGTKSYTATAYKYNDFLGWYDGEKLYSDEATIIVDGDEPAQLKAVFGTNGEISLDRFLNAAANTSEGEEKDYLNTQASFDLKLQSEEKTENYTLDIASSLAIDGDKNNLALSLKDEENKEKIALKIQNNASKTLIYLKIDEKEFNYDLPVQLKQFDFSGEYTSLNQLLGEEYYQIIHDILGYKNQLSFVEGVENDSTSTKITFRVDNLLAYVKDVVLPNIAQSDVWVKEILETFTKKYQGIGRTLPQMRLIFDIKYSGEEEKIADISGSLKLEEDYKLELEETVTIKKGWATFDCSSFSIAYGEELSTDIEINPEAETIEVYNLSIEGQVDFIQQDVATYENKVLSPYKLSLNADVNPFAVKEAIMGEAIDWNKIDWENFGYLNLRLSLIEDGTENQLSAHNDATDYLNVLIDSDKFGANMLVYVALYNPKMSMVGETITDEYILNSAVYLPLVIDAYGAGLVSSFPEGTDVNLGLVVDALKGVISFVVNSDSVNINDVMYKFIEGLMKSDDENVQAIKDNFYYEDGKIFLKLENEGGIDIKDLIAQSMSSFSSWLNYSNFTSNMFGSATHISFNFTTLDYGVVNDETKAKDLAVYNQKHITLVEADGGSTELALTIDYASELEALKGKDILINGLFSDGNSYNSLVDYRGEEVSLTMTIWDYEIISESDEKVDIKLYLTYTQGDFADILYEKNIPYGLVVCEKSITL